MLPPFRWLPMAAATDANIAAIDIFSLLYGFR